MFWNYYVILPVRPWIQAYHVLMTGTTEVLEATFLRNSKLGASVPRSKPVIISSYSRGHHCLFNKATLPFKILHQETGFWKEKPLISTLEMFRLDIWRCDWPTVMRYHDTYHRCRAWAHGEPTTRWNRSERRPLDLYRGRKRGLGCFRVHRTDDRRCAVLDKMIWRCRHQPAAPPWMSTLNACSRSEEPSWTGIGRPGDRSHESIAWRWNRER